MEIEPRDISKTKRDIFLSHYPIFMEKFWLWFATAQISHFGVKPALIA